MMFLSSRGRRKPLERFFSVSKPQLPGRVLIDADDKSYAGMTLPLGWEFFIKPRATTVVILNRAFKEYPDEPFYAILCDDMVYGPWGWDTVLSEAAGTKRVAWGDDGRWGPKLCTSLFVGGDLVREFGWLAHPAFGHLYADTVWWMIARGANIANYHPEIRATHFNVKDQTYKERRILGDASAFAKLRADGIPDLINLAAKLNGHIVHQS